MKILSIVCRVLLGLMFVVFGANILHQFLPPQPMPPPDSLAGQFFAVMSASGWLHVIGLLQILGGLLVLIGGTTPLGLVFLGPIIVNILIFHIHMLGGKGISMGIFATLLEVLLIYFYRANFAGIFTIKAQPVVKTKPVSA
jgi:putative oxidoreductase